MRKDGQRITGNSQLDEQNRIDTSTCLALGQQSLSAVSTFMNCMDAKGYIMVERYVATNVGKDYWITGVVRLCQVPSTIGTKCTLLPDAGAPLEPSNAHVKIDGIESGGVVAGIAFFHVTLDDGRTGYIMTFDLMGHGTDIDPVKAAADCKRRGDPRIGMTAKQVEATCWGKPDRVNRTETASVISDQYVYGDNRYVYLRNGIVTSIQATGTLR
jgi:hypothetical protein